MTLILGIDESGRGPVAGPLVLCGYMIDEKKVGELKKYGVKDSKLLTATKRERLFPKLKRLADNHHAVTVSAAEIDSLRTISNLNKIEIEKMQYLINRMKPDKVVIDAPEVKTDNFAKKIRQKLDAECVIVAENFADKKYPEVGAASIIAKVIRDREIIKLHKKYGNFGSGYSSDPVTIAFLKSWLKKNKEFPDFVRKSWITAQLMIIERQQTKIHKFVG
ncbi:MAG: ribonuclease HII [Candidatus Aenigmarchaeota archaeon]|nr:ribonuclease HII [Candidatus Aenigmarchaeota archaeon]